MWYIDLTFGPEPGHATVDVVIEPDHNDGLIAKVEHVNAKVVTTDPTATAEAGDTNGPASTDDTPALHTNGARFPMLTGAPLHAALGHISHEKFRAVRRHSVGISRRATIPQHTRQQCRGCMLGAATRSAIPAIAPYSTATRYAKAERWGGGDPHPKIHAFFCIRFTHQTRALTHQTLHLRLNMVYVFSRCSFVQMLSATHGRNKV